MGKTRIYELAGELGLVPKDVLVRAQVLGIQVTTVASGLDENQTELVRLSYRTGRGAGRTRRPAGSTRIYELARGFDLVPKEVLARAQALGIDVTTVASGLDSTEVDLVLSSLYAEPLASPMDDVGPEHCVEPAGADDAAGLSPPGEREVPEGKEFGVPSMSLLDLADEASAGLFARPGRTMLTILGTVIGLAALVATLGLSRTASNRIVGRFDELAATEILVSSRPASRGGPSTELPWDAGARLSRLNGVVAAGTVSAVDYGDVLISTAPVSDPSRRTDFDLSVQAVSPSAFSAVRASLATGRFFDEGFSVRQDRVALLGTHAAERLGIVTLNSRPAIRIGDDVFVIAGIIDNVGRQHDLLGSVVIPEGTARALYRLRAPDFVVVETQVGATELVSDQIPLALRPDNPSGLKVVSPPGQLAIRAGVEEDLNLLFIVLGAVSLLVGAIGIANVTLVSVVERTGEIGLRRALGAGRAHIAAQFLLESSVIGFVGGIIGASVGVLIVVSVAAYQSWTPVLDPWISLSAPFVGGVIGLIAGTYPASRAARMEPVEALRSVA